MINEKEARIIKKYCLFSYISIGAIIVPVLLWVEWLILEMIDELVFYNDKSNTLIINIVLGLTIFYFFIFIYFIFRNLIVKKGKKWKTIERNSCLTSEKTKNANEIAKRYKIIIPNEKIFVSVFCLIPLVFMIALYIPRYIEANNSLKERIEISKQNINKMESALSTVCIYTNSADPEEKYRDYGYYVLGDLNRTEANGNRNYVSVSIDNYGKIEEIIYSIDIDTEIEKQENLTYIEKSFKTLNKAINSADVPALSDDLLNVYELPEEFTSQFLEGEYYQDVDYSYYGNETWINYCFDTNYKYESESSKPNVVLYICYNKKY